MYEERDAELWHKSGQVYDARENKTLKYLNSGTVCFTIPETMLGLGAPYILNEYLYK